MPSGRNERKVSLGCGRALKAGAAEGCGSEVQQGSSRGKQQQHEEQEDDEEDEEPTQQQSQALLFSESQMIDFGSQLDSQNAVRLLLNESSNHDPASHRTLPTEEETHRTKAALALTELGANNGKKKDETATKNPPSEAQANSATAESKTTKKSEDTPKSEALLSQGMLEEGASTQEMLLEKSSSQRPSQNTSVVLSKFSTAETDAGEKPGSGKALGSTQDPAARKKEAEQSGNGTKEREEDAFSKISTPQFSQNAAAVLISALEQRCEEEGASKKCTDSDEETTGVNDDTQQTTATTLLERSETELTKVVGSQSVLSQELNLDHPPSQLGVPPKEAFGVGDREQTVKHKNTARDPEKEKSDSEAEKSADEGNTQATTATTLLGRPEEMAEVIGSQSLLSQEITLPDSQMHVAKDVFGNDRKADNKTGEEQQSGESEDEDAAGDTQGTTATALLKSSDMGGALGSQSLLLQQIALTESQAQVPENVFDSKRGAEEKEKSTPKRDAEIKKGEEEAALSQNTTTPNFSQNTTALLLSALESGKPPTKVTPDEDYGNAGNSQDTATPAFSQNTTALLLSALEQREGTKKAEAENDQAELSQSSATPSFSQNTTALLLSALEQETKTATSAEKDNEGKTAKSSTQTKAPAVKADPEDDRSSGSSTADYDEDVALTEMERRGDMTQVVGSQSLLSQEIRLQCGSQPEVESPREKAKPESDDDSTQEKNDGSKSPAIAARRYGLLLPKEEEDAQETSGSGEAVKKIPAEGSAKASKSADRVNCIQEEEENEEEERVIVGGQSLSQQLDLSALSQELKGLSQENLVWESQVSAAPGTIVPSVTPATSSQESMLAPPSIFDGEAEPDSAPSDSQSSFLSKGLECLLQAADQVSAKEGNKRPTVKEPPALARRTSGRLKRKEMDEPEKKETRTKLKTTKAAAAPKKKKAAPKTTPTKAVAKRKAAPPQKKPPTSSKSPKTGQIASPAPATAEEEEETPAPSSRRGKRKAASAQEEVTEQPSKKKRARATSPKNKPDHVLAKEAAALAARVINEEHLGKQLLLSMVMERQPTRTPPSTLPGPGHEMPPSFVWSHYPPLEKVLKEHMVDYYHLSLQKRQSAAQQAFNNELVQVVRNVAREERGWTIPGLDDKALRDRIRCYYKTHIQNAKKRLATMLKNPGKVANARHLVHHLHLIKQTLENPQPEPKKASATTTTATSPKRKSNPSRRARSAPTADEEEEDDDEEEELEEIEETAEEEEVVVELEAEQQRMDKEKESSQLDAMI